MTQAMTVHPSRILYRDGHLLIVQKLASELTVAAGGRGKLSLFDFLRKGEPGLRVLHRLDFETSGIVVFARTSKAAEVVRQSAFKGWKKRYLCIVAGAPRARASMIAKKLRARTRDEEVDAVSHYRTLHATPIASVVEVTIATGRKHQVRQHMASIGHPLLFDPLYGDGRRDQSAHKLLPYRRFFLHAWKLELPHPITGKHLHIEAPLPKTLTEALRKLKIDN